MTNLCSATELADLMQARRTTLPKRLHPPGPDTEQLQQILEAAASAPDHGQLLPWRFVRIGLSERAALGEAFAAALLERDPQATAEQVAQAQEKAQRAPLLLLVVVDAARGDAGIDLPERIISAGCAVQNMLLMATALGFGSALTSGKALRSQALRTLFQLQSSEHALCFISIGTVLQAAKKEYVRPVPAEYVVEAGQKNFHFEESPEVKAPQEDFRNHQRDYAQEALDNLLQANRARQHTQAGFSASHIVARDGDSGRRGESQGCTQSGNAGG